MMDGIKGNTLADEAAKRGRDDNVAPDWETPKLAKAVMHKEIDNMHIRRWEDMWNEVIGCRQTRAWFPTGPRPRFSKDIVQLPRIIVSQMVQLITGHAYLNRHQAIIDDSERQRIIAANDHDNADDDGNAIIDAPDPKCRLCKVGEETPIHLLTDCNAVASIRHDIFGREDIIGPRDIHNFTHLPVHKIVSFFRELKLSGLNMRPFLEEHHPTDLSQVANDPVLMAEKEAATKKGDGWLSRYLHVMPNQVTP